MARSIWTGVVSFGLVSVPVKVYSATKDHDVSFHQFEKGTGDRIRYQRVNERTGKEVDYSDIVRGAEVSDGTYVMLDSDELDSVAPGRSRSLDIHTFVEQSEIDPIYYQKTYYLGPGSDETVRTYALLRDAMADADRVAIGTLVMRGKEYLAAIRADGDLLVLETMFFADEVRDPKDDLDVPSRAKPDKKELQVAVQLIDSMTAPWKPDEFRDTYTDRVNELIAAKHEGNEVTVADEAPTATKAIDLLEALRASVEAAASRKRTAPAKKQPAGKKTPAAKHTAAAKSATAKAPATKAPATKTAATKTAATKKTATKKTPATKTAATKKTAAKKTATKSATGKSAAKKSASRTKAA